LPLSRGNPTTRTSHASSGGRQDDAEEEIIAHTAMLKMIKVKAKAKAKVDQGVLKAKAKAKAMEKEKIQEVDQRAERGTITSFPQARLRMEKPRNLHARRMRKDHVLEVSCVHTGMHLHNVFGNVALAKLETNASGLIEIFRRPQPPRMMIKLKPKRRERRRRPLLLLVLSQTLSMLKAANWKRNRLFPRGGSKPSGQ